MRTLVLKEAQAPYALTIDDATLAEGPVRVVRGGETIGVLVPPSEYEELCVWQEAQQCRPEMPHVAEQFKREVAAFERMLPELLQEDRDRVVAIHTGQVVAVGDAKAEVCEQVHQRLGDVIVYIQHVSEHPRILSSPTSEWRRNVALHLTAC